MTRSVWPIILVSSLLVAGCTGGAYPPELSAASPVASPTVSEEPLNIKDHLDLSIHEPISDGVGVLAGDVIGVRYPDSAGGVDVEIRISPVGSGTVKYAIFDVVPYNSVDDVVASEIGNTTTARLRYTGPLDAGGNVNLSFSKVWYSKSIAYVELVAVELEYMNGDILKFDLSGSPVRGDLECIENTYTHGTCRHLES